MRARLARFAAFVERRRYWLVGLCVAAAWAFIGREAIWRIPRNGWLFQHGDDGPWYWTSAWTLSSLRFPQTIVGMGWSYLLAPIAGIFGPNMIRGLPLVLGFNVLVLTPLAVVGMYLLAQRIAGVRFALFTTVLWVLAPVLALAFYNTRERPTVVESFLPTATGLNALSDFPSMVLAIYAAYLCLRAYDTGDRRDAVLCGLALGFLVLMKPGNGPLPLVALLLFAVTVRLRMLLYAGAAMIPAIVALTLWKGRGLGHVPLVSLGQTHEAAGPAAVAGIHSYGGIDFHHIATNMHALREVWWSFRLLELLFIAGSFGLIARTRLKGVFVVAWFVAFGVIKTSVAYAGIYDTSAYRFILPAWPAWVLIVAGVVFCWPQFPAVPRLPVVRTRRAPRWTVITVAVVAALGPLAVAVAARPIVKDSVSQFYADGTYAGSPIPVVDMHANARRTGPHTVELDWQPPKSGRGTSISYQVYKGRDDGCRHRAGAPVCYLDMVVIGDTRDTHLVDDQADARAFYRIGFGSGLRLQPDTPSLLMMSKPVSIDAP